MLTSVGEGSSERLALLHRIGGEEFGHSRSFIGGFMRPPGLDEERVPSPYRDRRPALNPEKQCAFQYVADLLAGMCMFAWSHAARDLDQGLHHLAAGSREISLLQHGALERGRLGARRMNTQGHQDHNYRRRDQYRCPFPHVSLHMVDVSCRASRTSW